MNHHIPVAEDCINKPNSKKSEQLGESLSPVRSVEVQLLIYGNCDETCKPSLKKNSVGSECGESNLVDCMDVLSNCNKLLGASGGVNSRQITEEQPPQICLQSKGDAIKALCFSEDAGKGLNPGQAVAEPLGGSVSQGMLSGVSEEKNMIGHGDVTSDAENLHMMVVEYDVTDQLKGFISPNKVGPKASDENANVGNHNSIHNNNASSDGTFNQHQCTKSSSTERYPSGEGINGNEQKAIDGCISVSDGEAILQSGLSMQDVRKESALVRLATPQDDASKVCGSHDQLGVQEYAARVCSGEPSGEIHETPCKESGAKAESSVKSERRNLRNYGLGCRRTPEISVKSEYSLRSSSSSIKARRATAEKKDAAPERGSNSENVSDGRKRKGKKKRQMQIKSNDEFSKMRVHLRYLLHRITYAQNLIDAYCSEGWRGQSLEKLKPEAEIQRAKMDINRSKLKIRGLFQCLVTISAEGRFPDSLFDSDGLIDSEDIYCAKCGSKELASNNDIILCDGVCDRGFHQFCLEQPLRTEDIPPGDEGWLCPACDCKVDCIDLLNDSQGAKLSIHDSWEKVFPEAEIVAGSVRDDGLGLPSDDSDDTDYDPDGVDEDDNDAEGSKLSSDESDFSSTSGDLVDISYDDQYLGLPSDDSEDDDFDPSKQGIDRQARQESSSSDFTSASENLAAAIDHDGTCTKEGPSEPSPDWDDSLPISGKRQVERLDYKKLYDETYANAGSSSSDDEDWTDAVEPKRRKNEEEDVDALKRRKHGPRKHARKNKEENDVVAPNRRKYATRKHAPISAKGDVPADAGGSFNMVTHANSTPGRSHKSPNLKGCRNRHPVITSSPGLGLGGRGKKGQPYKNLGEAVTQRLYSFKENQYPDHSTKEKIAAELGITLKQGSKWFGNARWSFNHSPLVGATTSQADSKGKICRSCRRGTESKRTPIGEGSGQKPSSLESGRRNNNTESLVLVQALPAEETAGVQRGSVRRSRKRSRA